MENQLLELLEYRNVLGALTTSLDGLLVASVAVAADDAELIAASTASHEDQGDVDGNSNYWTTTSEHGALHVARGREMRLIVLSEPGATQDDMRDLLAGHLQSIEDAISV